MLYEIETKHPLTKAEFETAVKPLGLKLGELQRECRARKIPVILLIHGPSLSGKGRVVAELVKHLDPRGFFVHTIKPPTDEENFRPFFWRFWQKLPANDRIAIFIRSWYTAVFTRQKGFKSTKSREDLCRRIAVFERQLADSGAIIMKFYLRASEKELRKRFEDVDSNPETTWRITKQDWKSLQKYGRNTRIADDILTATHRLNTPWLVIPADNTRYAVLEALGMINVRLEAAVQGAVSKAGKAPSIIVNNRHTDKPSLAGVDLNKSLDCETYEKELDDLQDRLHMLQHRVYRQRLPVAIVYEGWDAAGKGGNIRRLVAKVDPRGYDVTTVAAPSTLEKQHHYLWRFWINAPKAGHIAIFDRSWYGRLLVEKVEGFCTPEECERAYAEIVEMEKEWHDCGVVMVKFWLHISKEEQLRRFEARQNLDHKKWKITDEDWRNREKWDQYVAAIETMLDRTSTAFAPWTVVESNCKLHARVKALRRVVTAIEKGL